MTGSETDSPSKRPEASRTRGKEVGTNSMEDMPCVFTKGDGPNGRRVDGILYKYGKGEEVRIMCVCHGNFHSPAEFVKHAGGTDVDHPLKHIVVNPNSSSLL
ncbi:UNVERIFIED_CONTAM: Ninja-family protein AFP2 [Sesamum indicum]